MSVLPCDVMACTLSVRSCLEGLFLPCDVINVVFGGFCDFRLLLLTHHSSEATKMPDAGSPFENLLKFALLSFKWF